MKADDRGRRESLGGSDAAAVLGLNPYSSCFDVWLSKVGQDEDEFVYNQYIHWGLLKEKVIAEHYAERHGVRLIESPKRVIQNKLWKTGSPDRLIEFSQQDSGHVSVGFYEDPVSGLPLLKRGLEIKTGQAKHRPKWHDDGKIVTRSNMPAPVIRTFEEAKRMVPLSYYVQCCWYMDLMGFEEWDLCVLLDSSDYREYRIVADKDFMSWAITACEVFWKTYIETKREPPLDHGKSVNKYLASKFTEKKNGIIKIATPDENRKAAELKAIGIRMRDLIKEMDAVKNRYKETEEQLAAVEKELGFIKEDNDALRAYFRNAIGPDDGIDTDVGRLVWASTEKQARTLRWAKTPKHQP